MLFNNPEPGHVFGLVQSKDAESAKQGEVMEQPTVRLCMAHVCACSAFSHAAPPS